MGSTSAALLKSGVQLIPQAYSPGDDAYKPIAARQLGSSDYALEVIPRGLTPFAFESITATTTVKTLNSTTYASAIAASVEVQSASIRYRVDGTSPSTSVGHLAGDGDYIILESSGEIANFRMVLGSTTTATVAVTYST